MKIISAAAVFPPVGRGSESIAGVAIPDSRFARAATDAALDCEPQAIFNHSLRSYLFAELIARARAIAHDREIVYVASLLHDTGLTPAHMSASERFEVDGANLSRRIAEAHAYPSTTTDTLWDAVALHDQGLIARWKQPEVALVSMGVSADFGAHLDLLRSSDVTEILKTVPRTKFVKSFLDAVAVVAKCKPEATGNCFVTDVGYRMVHGFHLTNFCDDVKDDPFARFGF